MSNRITIQFVGDAQDKDDVRLGDLIDQLQKVRKALHETETAITGQAAALEYKVVDLRHRSPATFVFQPVALKAELVGIIPEVVHSFTTELRLIKREGKLLQDPNLERLEAYDGIGQHGQNRIQKVIIRSGQTAVTIDQKFKDKLGTIIGPDELTTGSISGMLDAVNFHETHRFILYPLLGPARVKGTFRSGLKPKIKEAIGTFVTILGELKYKAWSDFPHGVMAEDVDIHEPDDELPTLTDLRGAFPRPVSDTGQLINSAEFIDGLRYGEDW